MTQDDTEAAFRKFTCSSQWPPYARLLGIELDHFRDGLPVLACDYGDAVIGRPGFFHGGALSGLLEVAAICGLRTALYGRTGSVPQSKPVNITVSFQRGARTERCYATGEITRLGQRVANMRALAWQDDPEKPVAVAFMNFLLHPPG